MKFISTQYTCVTDFYHFTQPYATSSISSLDNEHTILLNTTSFVTHLYKTSHMSQKHKLSFSYVLKEEKMGFNLVQKIFICDN